MAKTDALIGAVIGFLIGTFFLLVLQAVQIGVRWAWLLPIVFSLLTIFCLFIASLIAKKFLVVYQLAKFLLVGAFNTLLDLGILNLLMWTFGIYTGIFFSVFKSVSFLVAATSSYFWNKHWTFEKRETVFARYEYFKFLTVMALGLGINVGAASLVVNVLGPQFGFSRELWANVGAFSAVFVSWIWNFTAVKFFVFKK